MRRFAFAALPLLALAACSGDDAAPAGDSSGALEAIRAVEAAQLEAILADNLEGATAPYAAEATVVPPGGDMVGGPQISGMFQQLMADEAFAMTPDEEGGSQWVSASGDLAVTGFTASYTHTGTKGEPVTERLANQTVWRLSEGGDWQIVSDINYILPPAEPAADDEAEPAASPSPSASPRPAASPPPAPAGKPGEDTGK